MSIKEYLITADEAVTLSGFERISALNIIADISEAVNRHAERNGITDTEYNTYTFLFSVFTAGRIQGIREERKKHKKPSVRVPRLNIKLTSDFKWQYLTLIDRLNNPDKYKEVDGDVNAVIEKLKAWLNEHISTAAEELTPEELDTLTRALSA